MKFTLATPAAMANRSAVLDCVRALAILAVFGFHVASRYGTEEIDQVAAFLQRFGFLGVDIFFPLSGFLISRFLLTSPRADFIRVFFLRRVFRILPLYFLALATYFVASQMMGIGADTIDRLWINATFLTGWYAFFEGKETIPFLITWSLSVEEFGYILLGLMALVWRKGLVGFLVVASLIAIGLRWGIMANDTSRETFQALYYLPPARLDSIALGGLTAYFLTKSPRALVISLLVLGAVLLYTVNIDKFHYRVFLFLLVAVGTCLFIVLAETTLKDLKGPVVGFFAAIGFYSYFNYLFQFFVIDFFLHVLIIEGGFPFPGFWVTFGLTLLVTHVLAALSYALFEGPIMTWGRRFEAKRNKQLTPAAG